MTSKDSDKTQAQPKPVPEPAQQLSDLPPKDVNVEDGNLIKGGPTTHPWLKPLT